MNIYNWFVLLILGLCYLFGDAEGAACTLPVLANGRVRLRSKGRIAKFNCLRFYQLLGDNYATCIRGRWDIKLPLCIRGGCQTIRAPERGLMLESYRGALVKFVCNPGYVLNGSSSIYCNGQRWNSSVPACALIEKTPELACDFESEDVCGWTQDTIHDFDWKRQNFATPSGHVGTGPSFDHTKGKGMDGYYMYIETSSPRIVNDTARLFSPFYNQNISQDACFTFWYHMYGATTGSLQVYIKPETSELKGMKPDFQVVGDQGNRWYRGVVPIRPMDTPFQVVVEAARGVSYIGDSAVDDVAISNGTDCIFAPPTSAPIYKPVINLGGGDAVFDDTQSCRWRCSSSDALTMASSPAPDNEPGLNGTAAPEVPVLVTCDCHAGCFETSTCCPDYSAYCIIALVTSFPTKATPRVVYPPVTYPPPPPLPPLPPLPTLMTSPALTHLPPPALTSLHSNSAVHADQGTPLVPHISRQTTLLHKEYISTSQQPATAFPARHQTVPTNNYWDTQTDLPSIESNSTTALTDPNEPNLDVSPKTSSPAVTALPNITNVTPSKHSDKPSSAGVANLITTESTQKQRTTVPFRLNPGFTKRSTLKTSTQSTPTIKPTTPNTKPTTPKIKPTTPKSKPTPTNTKPTTISTPKPTFTPKQTVGIRNISDPLTPTTAPLPQTSTKLNNKTYKDWKRAQKSTERRPRRTRDGLSVAAIAGIAVAVLGLVTIASITSCVVVRGRRRFKRHNNASEDSDVRFLTSDEILDFTLAKPSDDKEVDDHM